MTAARLNHRTNQRELIDELQRQLAQLQNENTLLKAEVNRLKSEVS